MRGCDIKNSHGITAVGAHLDGWGDEYTPLACIVFLNITLLLQRLEHLLIFRLQRYCFFELRKDFGRKINFACYFVGLGVVWGRLYPIAPSVLKIVCYVSCL